MLTVAVINVAAVAVVAVIPLAVGLEKRTRESNRERLIFQPSCHQLLEYVHLKHVTVRRPPALDGRWTSTSCEQRPGPQFLVRDYTFTSNSSEFQLTQYYYSNSACNSPLYAVSARGRLRPGAAQGSWLVPGGTEAEYAVAEVRVTPYTAEMAQTLQDAVNLTCAFPAGVSGRWRPYRSSLVLREHLTGASLGNYIERVGASGRDEAAAAASAQHDVDCTRPLHLAFHELQLMRQERSGRFGRELLYLGDVHTDLGLQLYYRPTAYQPALLRSSSSNCVVCKRVSSSNLLNPPRLFLNIRYRQEIDGSWASVHCETRPNGIFITRCNIMSQH